MRTSRSVLAALVIVPLLALAAACTSQADAGDPPIRIASIASETGSGAAYGVEAQRGTRLAVELLGNGRVDLRTFDDQSTNDGAMAAARSAVAWKAEVVLAPTLSPVALSIAPYLAQNRTPTLGVSNATIDVDAAGEFFWRISKSERDMVTASVDAAAKRGQKAVLIWEPADGYSAGSRDAFLAAAAAKGVEITSELSYVDGSTTAASLASKAEASSPDMLFMALRSAVAADFLSATASSKALRIGGNGFNAVPVISKAGSAANGLVVSGSWNIDEPVPMSKAFIDAYVAAYGSEPDSFAAQGYAAVQVALAAIRVGGGTSSAQVQSGLGSLGRRTNAIPTVVGQFGFTADREPTYPAVVQQVRSGTLVPFR